MLSTELVDPAVCGDRDVSLPFCPTNLGSLDDFGSNGSLLPKDRETSLQRHGEILGQVIWY